MLRVEKSIYSFILEAAVVRWAIGKFRKFLWGSEFKVLSDCSGLQNMYLNERLMYLMRYKDDEMSHCSTNS